MKDEEGSADSSFILHPSSFGPTCPVPHAMFRARMLQINENVPLAPLTTIGIGGPAHYFTRATSLDQIREAIDWAKRQSQPLFIMAGGSNLLISDEGFKGLVLHIDLRGIDLRSEDEFATVRVAAGEEWDQFVAMGVDNGLAGIECLS